MRKLNVQIALAFFAFIVIGANDGAVGVLLPSLQTHYHVDKATISLFFLAGTTGYLVAAFISGLLIDKLGEKLALALGAAAFLMGVTSFALMLPFQVVLAMLLPLGFGVAIIDAGLNSYIAQQPKNSALLNYLHAFYGVGALVGPLVASGFLAASWGWNTVYVVWIALGLLLLAGFMLLFSGEKPHHAIETETGSGNLLVAALRLRVAWLGALFMLLYVGAEVSLGTWGYSFLTEVRHQPELFSGWVVSGYWMGLTAGRFALARLAQRVGNKRLVTGCLVGVALGVLLTWQAPASALLAVGLGLTGFCLGPIYPTTIALTSQLVRRRLLPSVIGIVASAGSVGAAILPWQAGNLAASYGLGSLFPFVMAITALMLISWAALASGRWRIEGNKQ